MNQQLDDSKESAQSMERYLQNESSSNSPVRQIQTQRQTENTNSILKLQNGKYSNNNIFKDALNKKKSELYKKPQKAIENMKYERPQQEKQPKKMDKVYQNIKNVQIKAEEVKKKKEEEKVKEEKLKQSKVEHQKEDVDEAFNETVNRLYNYEKQRQKQLKKLQEEMTNKEKAVFQPLINEKSCKLLERKLKQLVEEEEDYKQIYQFKNIEIQVDLLPNLPKLKDYLIINAKKNTVIGQQIEIIVEENHEEQIELAEGVEYQENQEHKIIQTNEIKYKIGDTMKKQQQQQQQQQPQQTSQFIAQDTPNKKVQNQRQKRQEFMEAQGQRVKTELQYYVPLHIRQQKIIQKKEEWVKSQIQLKKEKEEESFLKEKVEWETEREKWSKKKELNKSVQQQEMNVEEFANSQIHWLEKRNEHILSEQMKKDKEILQSLTFRPQIQKKNVDTYQNTKVEDRLLEYQQKKQENLQKLENKYLPSFQPNLKNKSLISMDWASKSFNNTSFNKLWQ